MDIIQNDLNSIDQKGMDGSYCYCRLEKRKDYK